MQPNSVPLTQQDASHKLVYFDHAATSLPKPHVVVEAVTRALQSFGNASRGVYAESLDATSVLYECRVALATLFGAPRADHVIFTPNATGALNIALKGLLGPGDHVVTDVSQHNSVLRPLYQLQADKNVALSFAPVDNKGRTRLEDYERLITPNTKMIVCQHGSNVTGNLFDIAALGALAHEHGLLFVVDAAQTAGLVPIDMQKMHIDVLCFTGHKSLLGPQGTGGMCVREGLTIQPLLSGGTGIESYNKQQPDAYPEHLEAGTVNSHGIAGLYAALGFIGSQTQEALLTRANERAEQFLAGLAEIAGITLYGDMEAPLRLPVVSLNMSGYESYELADLLSYHYKISTRPGAHCAPLLHEALGTQELGAVRFSFSASNTEEEVEFALAALRALRRDRA